MLQPTSLIIIETHSSSRSPGHRNPPADAAASETRPPAPVPQQAGDAPPLSATAGRAGQGICGGAGSAGRCCCLQGGYTASSLLCTLYTARLHTTPGAVKGSSIAYTLQRMRCGGEAGLQGSHPARRFFFSLLSLSLCLLQVLLVESPAKAKKIQGFLGEEYKASKHSGEVWEPIPAHMGLVGYQSCSFTLRFPSRLHPSTLHMQSCVLAMGTSATQCGALVPRPSISQD